MNNKTHEVHFRISEEAYEFLRNESGLRGITINSFLCETIGDLMRADLLLREYLKENA